VADSSSGPPAYCQFADGWVEAPSIEAVLQYGDNGGPEAPELLVQYSTGQFTWQSPTQVMFDSGLVSVEFKVAAGGNATLTAARGTTVGSVNDNVWSMGPVWGVQVGAAVIAVPRRRMTWSNVAVKYYRAGQLTESILRGSECDIRANTMPPAHGPAAVVANFNPQRADNDAVTITGTLRLEGDRVDPNFEFSPSDFYAKIRVYADNIYPRA
jgi:hypothetical protein